uniref:Reticulon n=1 Tax=Oryzias latipes TaxID=8090 RepID=A0A3B3H991_ORYLA
KTTFQLINWREPKRSAAAFGLSLLVLISVATLSVISVLSYLVLACLCVTITFRIYKSVIQAIQKSDEGHPFRSLLEKDISISSEAVRELGDQCLLHLNCFTSRTRRLLLVEDLVDSLKLATVMWVMTYVGGMFNGITILILGVTVIQPRRNKCMDEFFSITLRKYISDLSNIPQVKKGSSTPLRYVSLK